MYYNCTVYSVHCTVFSVQCTVYSVQCIQCTVYILDPPLQTFFPLSQKYLTKSVFSGFILF